MAKRSYKSKKRYDSKARDEKRQTEKKALDGKINLLVNSIADKTDEAKASDHFKRWVAAQSKFHNYSYRNTLLILSQMPEATQVAGYNTWLNLGRQVVEKGKIRIFAPAPYKVKVEVEQDDGTKEEQEQQRMHFRPVTVFDISQTEGEDLPTLEYRIEGEDNGTVEILESLIHDLSIQLEYVDSKELRGASGCSMGGHIKILDSLEGAERAATLTHEIAHELLHKGDLDPLQHSRSVKEIEAEATAAVVLSSLGINMEGSKFYLACWNGDGEKVRKSMDNIGKASKQILEFVKKAQKKAKKEAKAA